MFKPSTPMYLSDVVFGSETKGDETKKTVTCSFHIQPFTSEMADELGLRAELFNSTSGEPKDVIADLTARINLPIQQMQFARSPDIAPSLTLQDVKIESKLKVRRDKEGPVFAATMRASFFYPTGADLLYLANGVNEQHFMSFATQQGALNLEPAAAAEKAPTRRRRRDVEEPPADEAPAPAMH